MKALITGASSGIGRDIARCLSDLGYDLIVIARREDRLKELASSVSTNVKIIPMDISSKENCFELYNLVKDDNIDVLINNAGFGYFGEFTEIPLETELNMIDTNIVALHMLTKLFLQDMKKRNSGYILNVASLAGFMSGPLMATYYASKNYVLRLTTSINEELRKSKSNVSVSTLCPGPVKTEFNTVANVKFLSPYADSMKVAKYAVKKMFKRKLIITPTFIVKAIRFFTRLTPDRLLLKITYKFQVRKRGENN